MDEHPLGGGRGQVGAGGVDVDENGTAEHLARKCVAVLVAQQARREGDHIGTGTEFKAQNLLDVARGSKIDRVGEIPDDSIGAAVAEALGTGAGAQQHALVAQARTEGHHIRAGAALVSKGGTAGVGLSWIHQLAGDRVAGQPWGPGGVCLGRCGQGRKPGRPGSGVNQRREVFPQQGQQGPGPILLGHEPGALEGVYEAEVRGYVIKHNYNL